MTTNQSMSETTLREAFGNGLRCKADRDGDCDCNMAYRVKGINHCYLDILADEADPERHGV